MRHTFLLADHDCGEEIEVVVQRHWGVSAIEGEEVEIYLLVSWPSVCKCGRPIPLWESTQNELMAAYALPEAEDV